MTDARFQPANWETADWRVTENPADWYGTTTCLTGGCGWKTEPGASTAHGRTGCDQ